MTTSCCRRRIVGVTDGNNIDNLQTVSYVDVRHETRRRTKKSDKKNKYCSS